MTRDRAAGIGRSDDLRAYSERECAARLTTLLAPRTGDIGEELTLELSEYFRTSLDDIRARLSTATESFTEEWNARVADGRDEDVVTRFYNESRTEIFDLAQWHSNDPIHYRVLMCADIAHDRGCRDYLDYGSGIGSDALVFASVGCRVTLADVSEPLLAFAKWRCERRGFAVNTVDLKKTGPPRRQFDAVVCFDVLEHIHRPLRTLWNIQQSMHHGGMLFMHAPFGQDPDRPMHVVHKDVVTPKMRTVGFHRREDLETPFPEWLWHPLVYQSFDVSPLDRLGYRVYDEWLKGGTGAWLARAYRRLRPNRYALRLD
jgi:2-polyprenyl-3-methyl-5-hydroxy-6-metoxy-1,4-benzoquinol methylase